MLPITPLLYWPAKTHMATWLTFRETDGVFKKIVKGAYNVIIPTLITLFSVAVVAAGLVLVCLYNAVLWPPLAIRNSIHNRALAHSPPQNTFKQRPAGVLENSPEEQTLFPYGEVCSKHFPATFVRSSTEPLTSSPPQITFSWPKKDQKNTNSLFLDFMQEKVTFPKTNMALWNLFQKAGTPEGYNYINANILPLVSLLFPTLNPCPLNQEAPVLDAVTLGEIQTNAEIRSKYIFATLILLQSWGIVPNKEGTDWVTSPEFVKQAAAFATNKHRALIFKQVITSLGECGFAVPATLLANFVNKQKRHYKLSQEQDMLEPLQQVRALEIQALQEADPERGEGQLRSYQSKFPGYASEDENRLPSDNKWTVFLSSAWNETGIFSPKPPLFPEDLAEINQKTGEDSSLNRLNLPQLKAPPFFCSLEEEKQINTSNNSNEKKDVSAPNAAKKKTSSFGSWWNHIIDPIKGIFDLFLSPGSASYAPLADDMNTPPNKEHASYPKDVTSPTLPFLFSRDTNPQPSVNKLTAWPALNGQHTNSFGEDFLEGKVTIPGSDTSFWSLIRQDGTQEGYRYLEISHDVVQTVIPTKDKSHHAKDAPVLSRELLARIQTDPAMASKYLLGVFSYIQFWGGELDQQGRIVPSADFAVRASNVKQNPHNHKRIARAIKSLSECGFNYLASELHQFCLKNMHSFGLESNSNARRPSSFLRDPESYIQKNRSHKVDSNWNTRSGTNYLSQFRSSSGKSSEQLAQTPPKWFSSSTQKQYDPVFASTTPLLKWSKEHSKWLMPELKAPPFFRVRGE